MIKKTEIISKEERAKDANYYFAVGLLDELVMEDWSDEKYNKLKDSYLRGKVTYKSWRRYIDEGKNQKPYKDELEKKKELRMKFLNKFILAQRDKQYLLASEYLVEYLFLTNIFYCTKNDFKSELWYYNEGIYVANGRSHVKGLLRELLGQHYSINLYKQVIAKIEADCFIEEREFFNNSSKYPNLIPVKNGILNIFTRELFPFTKEKIFFTKLPISYKEGITCPKIEEFMREIVSHEGDITLLYELFGFCLMKEYRYEKAFMFLGNGRNGKGKFIELIRKFLGHENCCSVPLVSISPESFSLSELHNKLVNIAGDIGYKDLKDTSMLKSITGRDLIGAKRKFLNDIFFENFATQIFACNELPMVYDTSRGFWERWILLEFPYTFVDEEEYNKSEDKNYLKIKNENIIKEIVSENELTGLLNKALEGLERLKNQRKFTYTLGSTAVKEKWIRGSNSFIAFCLDKIKENYDSCIIKKDIKKVYNSYCKEFRLKKCNDYVIKKILQENYGVSEDRKSFLGKTERVWEGISWKV